MLRGQKGHTLWQKKVERIRRIPSHGVAALRAFGIDRGILFELNQINTCFTFQQVLYLASL